MNIQEISANAHGSILVFKETVCGFDFILDQTTNGSLAEFNIFSFSVRGETYPNKNRGHEERFWDAETALHRDKYRKSTISGGKLIIQVVVKFRKVPDWPCDKICKKFTLGIDCFSSNVPLAIENRFLGLKD